MTDFAERAEKGPKPSRPFSSQDRFYLARCPDRTGTITRVTVNGFYVTYDERDVHRQRVRKFITWDLAYLFKLGTSPAVRRDNG